jgi:hypothetical protein
MLRPHLPLPCLNASLRLFLDDRIGNASVWRLFLSRGMHMNACPTTLRPPPDPVIHHQPSGSYDLSRLTVVAASLCVAASLQTGGHP